MATWKTHWQEYIDKNNNLIDDFPHDLMQIITFAKISHDATILVLINWEKRLHILWAGS